MMPNRIGTNAPVGPPICTRLPPSAEMRKPATIAVHNPRDGSTPEAIANPMASGSATTPTDLRSPRASRDRKSTRLNSSHLVISYAVFCLKKKKTHNLERSDVTHSYAPSLLEKIR